MGTWLVQTKRADDQHHGKHRSVDHRHDVKREVTDQVRPGDIYVFQTSVKSNRTSLSSSIASAKLRDQQRQVEMKMKVVGFQKKRNFEEAKLPTASPGGGAIK